MYFPISLLFSKSASTHKLHSTFHTGLLGSIILGCFLLSWVMPRIRCVVWITGCKYIIRFYCFLILNWYSIGKINFSRNIVYKCREASVWRVDAISMQLQLRSFVSRPAAVFVMRCIFRMIGPLCEIFRSFEVLIQINNLKDQEHNPFNIIYLSPTILISLNKLAQFSFFREHSLQYFNR